MAAEAVETTLDPEIDPESRFRVLGDMWEKLVIDDHDVKPKHHAAACVPSRPVTAAFTRRVRLLSELGDDGREQETDVAPGIPIDLPEPWGLTLDTATPTA